MTDQPAPRRSLHRWQPIDDLPEDAGRLASVVREVADLRRAWQEKRVGLTDAGAVETFLRRIVRLWSVETGSSRICTPSIRV
jgi:hypothetical protein